MRTQRTDVSWRIVSRWSQPIAVPALPDLKTHLQRLLTDEEKVPLSQYHFNALLSLDPLESSLTREELEALCRISEEEEAYAIETVLRNAITGNPPATGTEAAFHSTWDDNIAKILKLAFLASSFVRDSNHNMSTGLKIPDYGFLLKNHCILRGEEKSPNSDDDPKAELTQKLIWTYDPLSYIFGSSWAFIVIEGSYML